MAKLLLRDSLLLFHPVLFSFLLFIVVCAGRKCIFTVLEYAFNSSVLKCD